MDVDPLRYAQRMAVAAAVERRRGACCQVEVALAPERAAAAAALLKALADPMRLSILATLGRTRDPVCVCDFTASYALSQPTISHHMARLRAAGLVQAHKHGIWTYYRLADPLPPVAASVLDALGG